MRTLFPLPVCVCVRCCPWILIREVCCGPPLLVLRMHQVIKLYCPVAGFHCAAISRPGSEEHWPPGPDSPVGSLLEHPDAACMHDHLLLPGREGYRMLWLQTLWENTNSWQRNYLNRWPMDHLIHLYLKCFERTMLFFTLHFRKGVCAKWHSHSLSW